MDKKKDKIMIEINKFVKKVRKHINVEKIFLFGSRARENYRNESDVDILIISKDFEGIKFFKRSPQLYLLWDAHYSIDIICLTPREFEEKIKEVGILREVITDGIEL